MPSRCPEKMYAHRMVAEAISRGEMTRPSVCSKCGRAPKPMRDGRPSIQGHHHLGHDKPLDVVWLCIPCHNKVTPQNPNKGEKVPSAKLTRDIVLAIRRSTLSGRKIGRIYGVDQTCVSQLRRRITWAWLED